MWIFFKEIHTHRCRSRVEVHLQEKCSSRMFRNLLRRQGMDMGRLHVGTLMKKMGIESIYHRPNTSEPAPGHRIYPYLLRGLTVDRPNQVSRNGHKLYPYGAGLRLSVRRRRLVQPQDFELEIVDHNGRRFCIEALEDAFAMHGRPEVFNTDQGSQFGAPGDRSSSLG